MKSVFISLFILLFSTPIFAAQNMPERIKIQVHMGKLVEAELDEIDLSRFVLKKRSPYADILKCDFDYVSEENARLYIGEASYKLVSASSETEPAHNCEIRHFRNRSRKSLSGTLELRFKGELSDVGIYLTHDILQNKTDTIFVVPNYDTGIIIPQAGRILKRY